MELFSCSGRLESNAQCPGRKGFHVASAKPALVAFSMKEGTTEHVELKLLPFHGKKALWAIGVFHGEQRELGADIPETFKSSDAIQVSRCGK